MAASKSKVQDIVKTVESSQQSKRNTLGTKFENYTMDKIKDIKGIKNIIHGKGIQIKNTKTKKYDKEKTVPDFMFELTNPQLQDFAVVGDCTRTSRERNSAKYHRATVLKTISKKKFINLLVFPDIDCFLGSHPELHLDRYKNPEGEIQKVEITISDIAYERKHSSKTLVLTPNHIKAFIDALNAYDFKTMHPTPHQVEKAMFTIFRNQHPEYAPKELKKKYPNAKL